MHPTAFKVLFGDEAYHEVLSRPRIVSEYDFWTEYADPEQKS